MSNAALKLKRKIYFTRSGAVYITDRPNAYSIKAGEKVMLTYVGENLLYLEVKVGLVHSMIHITRERAMKVFDKKDLMVSMLMIDKA